METRLETQGVTEMQEPLESMADSLAQMLIMKMLSSNATDEEWGKAKEILEELGFTCV